MGVNLIPRGLSEQQKEAYLFSVICREYEGLERISGSVNIPYFIRARNKVDLIKAQGELDKQFKDYMRKEKENAKK